MIPLVNLHAQHKELEKEIKRAINSVIKKGDFILGHEVGLFEKEFAAFCGTRYSVGVSSGTAALFLTLLSLGIEEGDEVIVPDFTYIATANAVSYAGAKPVFVDIEQDTYNIDTREIEKAITQKTKAIIPVHLFGQPANMPAIIRIAQKYNLKIIEDAAQAHGAMIKMNGKWRMVGSIGDASCFSFYPSKNLGALGDAGIVVTNNEYIYKKLLVLRDCGRVSKYEHSVIGYNARLDTLQAAILRVKLKRLKRWNQMRIRAAQTYNRLFQDTNTVITPFVAEGVKHIYHVYALRIKRRDRIVKALKKNGIAILIHYPIPLHLQKAYADLKYKERDFPVSEKIAKEIISLPMYPHLQEKQIKFIVKVIKEALEE